MPALSAGILQRHFPATGAGAMLMGAIAANIAGAKLHARSFSKESTAIEITL